ncbi:sigma-70 family RNA polymerase sigma factor [Candidatus Saccharibacteria bacterium]|nr:sigma-70 family RNA polymerase sigma factor [Candidatus Saccharibacteria bacterium]
MKNEQQLIGQILQGDQEKYAELIDRYKDGLYLHCFSIVRDEDAAEDLAQEAFIQAYRQLKKYDEKYRFSTWLYKIATNKAIDHLRKKSPHLLNDEELDNLKSQLPSPDVEARFSELHHAVDNLPANFRSVLSLYYWQGQSYEEIAEIMQVPIGSVRGWISRAKLILRKELS